MENRGMWPCYIGATKTGAGIFLSDKIIERKKYGNYIRTETFDSFAEAWEIFFERYGNIISPKDFRINKLHTVKTTAMYSVFSSPYLVGLTYSDFFYENMEKILPAGSILTYVHHDMEYANAVRYVRNHFARRHNNPRLYIDFAIRLHQPIYLHEVKRTNKVLD